MRRLLAVLTWSVVYFYASSLKIHNVWRVSVFKFEQWKKLFVGWRSGEWVIDTPVEYMLCIVLLLWIPIWLIGLFFILRLTKKSDSQQVVRQAAASHPFIPAYTPANMPSQGKSMAIEPPAQTSTSQNTNTTTNQDAQTDWVPKDDNEANALDVITQIAEENGLTPFPHVLLENELIPITISSDVDAFLIKVLAVQGTWSVSMTEPLEQSIWSCNGQSKNVLKEIVLGKGILSKMEPESKVIPVVVLAQGNIENQDTILNWLLQRGVEVVTLPENSQNGIPQLNDILVKYFGTFEDREEQNEVEQSSAIQEASV